jgi:hypothetical protein
LICVDGFGLSLVAVSVLHRVDIVLRL